jgi:hypothetical protein
MRFIIGALAVIGLVALVSGEAIAVGGVATGFLWLLVPLFFFKFMLFGMFFGGRRMARGDWQGGPPWMRDRDRRDWRPERGDHTEDRPDRTADFEEWHRMAHAREEVDSWVDGSPDPLEDTGTAQ